MLSLHETYNPLVNPDQSTDAPIVTQFNNLRKSRGIYPYLLLVPITSNLLSYLLR
jgi:hypothetical protein